MKCTSTWPILELAQNIQKMYNINRTYMQNTLTSTGPILKVVENIQNKQALMYKTRLLVRFTTGSEVQQFLNYVVKVSGTSQSY